MSIDIAKYPTLALAETPEELRLLPKESLPKLCDELRQFLLSSVGRLSGHFASGLVLLNSPLHYIMSIKLLSITLSGMWAIKPTPIRF